MSLPAWKLGSTPTSRDCRGPARSCLPCPTWLLTTLHLDFRPLFPPRFLFSPLNFSRRLNFHAADHSPASICALHPHSSAHSSNKPSIPAKMVKAGRFSTRPAPPHPARPYATNILVSPVVAGAAGGIGQPLSLLLKLNPLIDELALYDVVNTPGVATDLSHISTKAVSTLLLTNTTADGKPGSVS